MSPADRGQYIAGLRKLADLLEQHDAKLPETGTNPRCNRIAVLATDRAEMAAWAPLLEDACEETKGTVHYLRGRIGGAYVSVYAGSGSLGGETREVTRTTTEYAVPPILAETDPPMSDRVASAIADLMLADAELRGEVSA